MSFTIGLFVSFLIGSCCHWNDSCCDMSGGSYSGGYSNTETPTPSRLYDNTYSYQSSSYYYNTPCMPEPTQHYGNTSYSGGVYVGDHIRYSGTY
jgi:hypothetical protein